MSESSPSERSSDGIRPSDEVDRPDRPDRSSTADRSRPIAIVSNRLPFTVLRTSQGLERRPSTGGLVSALSPVLSRRGGTWIGWSGIELREGERIPDDHDLYRIADVPLTEVEIQRYYHGFSNRTMWPLCHSLPALARFDRRDWIAYERVNQRFADVTVEHARTDLIWVQDYHLMLVPERVRLRAPEASLAFFFHIPFPSYDIFRLCPWDRELLQGMLACDLIGFHVEGYARNFLDCVERLLGARVDWKNRVVEYGDLTSQVGVFPLGIEFGSFERDAKEAPEAETSRRERVVLGVDRLDYTKGIPQRIHAIERLLELHPEHRESVTFLQLAVPSRSQVAEYRELKREIDELVGRLNGRFATADWSPIRYLYRTVPKDRLAALYRDADVALVTPLRDGMNLVAKEFVACQVNDPGVLILSRLAGAAETMREALFVNPYNIDETAAAVHRALEMDAEERASRMAALRRRERRDDVEAWVQKFLDAALESHGTLQPVTADEFEAWLSGYIRGYRLELFLDYDGTLTPLCEHPSKAVLTPEMRQALESAAARPDTELAIVSGRSIADVRAMVGHEALIYAGNHGLEIGGPGLESFRHEDLVHFRSRAEALAKQLAEIEERGAWTEAKGPTLTFHVRAVPEKQRPELLEKARRIMSKAGYQARDAHSALEARPPIGWDKGRAVLHILRERYGPSWSEKVRVIYVGDDQTDEDAFRFLAGLSITFRVGSAETVTAATRRLPNVAAVRALLEWISKRRLPDR